MSQSRSSDVEKKGKLPAYFNEWVEGLAAALLWVDARFSRRQHFELRTYLGQLTLLRKGAAEAQPVFSRDIATPDPMPEALLQATRNGIIDIVVPEVAVVGRQLDPLPAESRPYIANVVRHQNDSIFPWRAADVLHSMKIEKRNDGMLDVYVRATSRAAIKDELALAQEAGADEVFVVTDKTPVGILAFVGPDRETRLNKARFVARYAAISALVLCISVVGWSTIERWSLASNVAALDDTIVERQSLLKRRSNLAGSQVGRSLGEKKLQAPAAVVVLDELSVILPDNTYLTDLSLEGSRLRITGVSANAVNLPVLLEKSGQFKNVSFYAPTTRISDAALDRFSIEASLVPLQERVP